MSDPSDPPVTVEIRRRVRADARPRFEADLQALIKDSLRFHEDGHQGVTVYAPDAKPGVEAEYRVVLKFARQSQWRTCKRPSSSRSG